MRNSYNYRSYYELHNDYSMSQTHQWLTLVYNGEFAKQKSSLYKKNNKRSFGLDY